MVEDKERYMSDKKTELHSEFLRLGIYKHGIEGKNHRQRMLPMEKKPVVFKETRQHRGPFTEYLNLHKA